MMNMMGGRRAGNNRKLAQAQAIKDATMGWFIARNIKNKFLHINGSYHSNRQGGIIPYLGSGLPPQYEYSDGNLGTSRVHPETG